MCPSPSFPNIHILPCPWFIHQNQEIYIGATLFITTQNCRLHTDFTNFPTNDLFFSVQGSNQKTTLHFVIMSRPEGLLLKAQRRSFSCFKLNEFPQGLNKTGAPGSSLQDPHTLALQTPLLSHSTTLTHSGTLRPGASGHFFESQTQSRLCLC